MTEVCDEAQPAAPHMDCRDMPQDVFTPHVEGALTTNEASLPVTWAVATTIQLDSLCLESAVLGSSRKAH